MNTQTNLLQDFFCIKILSLVVVGHIFFFAQVKKSDITGKSDGFFVL